MNVNKKNKVTQKKPRENWSSKLGIILAVAGSAVGLGNFLRFPVQAVNNGGGAFMIPYFVSLLVLGIPLMWIEWTVGRFGGAFGHGTAPGAFHSLWKNRWIKYFGIIGIFGPLVILIYYTYIESWLLGYTFFSLMGSFKEVAGEAGFVRFLSGYQGVEKNEFFSSLWPAYFFFLVTFLLNIQVLKKGISNGIERLAKIAMPALLIMSVILLIRVLTLGSPNPAQPDWSIWNGLGFLWNPDFSQLLNAKIWLAAAGQVFFTLSVGIGVIITYASYLKRDEDVALSGLSSVSVNEVSEVIFGGSIVIPVAFAFFGPLAITTIAASGSFNLGFVTMPLIFQQIPFGMFFSTLWFGLLFIAGITSSVSIAQPIISFLEDEFGIAKQKAVNILTVVAFVLSQPAIFFLSKGVVDELDFWGGTFSLVLFATIETILFVWVYGIDRAWEEMHRGAQIRIPKVYRFIIKYITPAFLFFILFFWFFQDGISVLMLQGVPAQNIPYIVLTRAGLAIVLIILALLVHKAWKDKPFPPLKGVKKLARKKPKGAKT